MEIKRGNHVSKSVSAYHRNGRLFQEALRKQRRLDTSLKDCKRLPLWGIKEGCITCIEVSESSGYQCSRLPRSIHITLPLMDKLSKLAVQQS